MRNILKETKDKKEKMRILTSSIFVWLISSLILLIIGETLAQGSYKEFLKFFKEYPFSFLLNYVLVLAISSIAFLFTKTKSVLFLIETIIAIGYIGNTSILAIRGTPVVWADMYSMNEGLSMVKNYGLTKYIIPAVILVAFIIGIFIFLCSKEKSASNNKVIQLIGLPVIIIALFLPKLATNLCIKLNKQPEIINYDLKYSYKINGTVFSFLNSIKEFKVSEPENYSEDTINNIVEKIENYSENNKSQYTAETQPNVIFIQLESYIDPKRLEGVNVDIDPIPTLRSLMNDYTSGTLQASCFGGGTVRCEFETLTGFSTGFLPSGTIPNNNILKAQSVDSIAKNLNNIGYTSSLVHNYTGAFYSRDTAVKSYGFDYYIPKEFMRVPDNYGKFSYPEDTINLDTMSVLLENSTLEPQFIYNVTVESHGPYSKEDYDGEYMVSSDTLTKEELNEVQKYCTQLKGLDDYIAGLLELINNTKRPTVLVMYSDHLPSLEVTKRMDSTPKEGEFFSKSDQYTTEVIVWDNISEEHNKESLDIQTYQVQAYVADRYNLPGTMASKVYSAYKDSSYEEYLDALELLQYDMLYGKNYAGKNLDLSFTDTVMGLKDIVLNSYEINDSTVTLKGENFTLYSKVIVDNKILPTTYVDSNTLEINIDELSNGNIKIGQVSTVVNSENILRTSNSIEFNK